MSRKHLIVITGPTASGKSALAISLARELGAGIISADSRQIYRHIPVITAVPTIEERHGIPHHLMEELELDEYFSASEFERRSLLLLEEMFRRCNYAVVCGGSMMYIDALCNGIDDIPTIPDDIRTSTLTEFQTKGLDWALDELHKLDPVWYQRVDRANHKRIVHAIEICRTAGVPYSSLLGHEKPARPFEILKFRLSLPRDVLFDRINRRVELMMEAGAIEEARNVYPCRNLNSLNTVGFKELFRYFDGEWDLPTAIARIQKNTRVYAKKQITWFNRDADIITLPAASDSPSPLKAILNYLTN